jgi:LysM repeat protein
MRRIPAAPVVVALALLASACGGSDDEPTVVSTTTLEMFDTSTTEAPATTTTTEAVYEAPATTTEAPAEAPATTTEAPAETPSDVPESVTVEEGDSLSKIAKRYGTTVDALVRINEMCDPNQIFVGQVILLADPDAESTDEDEAAGDVLIVTVQAGDSLSKIAKRHDTTVEDIMARNAIEDANLLFVGQELVIDGEVPDADEEPEENPYC